jgi:hypothetical protein
LRLFLRTALDLALAIVVGGLIAAPLFIVGWCTSAKKARSRSVP